MDQFAWLEPLFSSVKKILKIAWALVIKWPIAIALAIAVIALLFNVYEALYRSYVALNEKQFTVYVGPPGSSSNYTAPHVKSAVEKVSAAPGTHFHSVVRSLGSTTDVADQVLADTDGQSIGVTFDRSKDADGIATLLPLDWEYLHILVNVKFLDRICNPKLETNSKKIARTEWPSKFSEVVGKLNYGRVYCDGGSTDIAAELIERSWAADRKDLSYFLSPKISNLDAANAALREDQLDVVFFSGRLGATTIKNIAQYHTAILLGLDDQAESLKRDCDATLVVTEFPENSYSVGPFRVEGLLPIDFQFCGKLLKTVATRRLIIASKHMSMNDAYLISSALSENLSQGDGLFGNTWKQASPDNSLSASGANAPLGITPHPGAIAALEGVTISTFWDPSTWSTWVKGLGLAVVALVATKALRWYSKSDTEQNAAANVASESAAQADQQGTVAATSKAQIAAAGAEIRELAPPIATLNVSHLRERIATLTSEIGHRCQDPNISLDEAEYLQNGTKVLCDALGQLVEELSQLEKRAGRAGDDRLVSSGPGLLAPN